MNVDLIVKPLKGGSLPNAASEGPAKPVRSSGLFGSPPNSQVVGP
jgi:hypothetical protein